MNGVNGACGRRKVKLKSYSKNAGMYHCAAKRVENFVESVQAHHGVFGAIFTLHALPVEANVPVGQVVNEAK